METIDFIEHQNDFIGLALAHIMGDKYKEIMPLEKKAIFDIEVKLNGVEVSFVELLKLIEENYDKQVKVAALALVKEKFGDINTMVYNLERHVTDVVRTELKLYGEE